MNTIGCIVMGVMLNVIPISFLMFFPVQYSCWKVYGLGWIVNLSIIGIIALYRHIKQRFK
jgi:hypothetical protein